VGRRLRILLVENDARIGGSGRSFMHLIAGLSAGDVDLFAACPPDGPVSDWLRDRRIPRYWPPQFAGRGLSIGSQVSWATWFAVLLRRRRVDLIHVNDVAGFRLAGWGARMAGIPSVCHVRMAPCPDELVWSFGLARPDVIVFNSRAMAEYTRPQLTGPAARVPGVIIPNAVDTDCFRPSDHPETARTRLGWHADTPAVTVVSNLSPLKGQDLFIDAAATVCRNPHTRAEFHLVGRDLTPERRVERGIQQQIERYGLSDRVHVHGALDDVVSVFQASDILVWPSRAVSVSPSGDGRPVHSVGFPRCAIEAAACGRPMILADTPGAEEAVIRDQTALLVPPENPAALASAMNDLLADPSRREALGHAARALVESRFDLRHHVRLVERLYRSVIESNYSPAEGTLWGPSQPVAGQR
jgi:glycosyltransferase involved in cell wall biosynthesis